MTTYETLQEYRAAKDREWLRANASVLRERYWAMKHRQHEEGERRFAEAGQ